MTAGLDDVDLVSSRLAECLTPMLAGKQPFCLWLVGDLGAGKTYFASNLLHRLGLAGNVPVLSPTYTYLTEYQVGGRLMAHMDLYRLINGDNDSLQSLIGQRNFDGLIVEWPERCPNSDLIEPSFILKIENDGIENRRYTLLAR
ncbi:MAG: tRNA (adenosine(37)-N6)-threonylcarbamoyltransferase complex ATPase subunit type 1 TsaE [Proteobacteria bacterium]|nr:tRNA (adenosine(37)-N6)-threonylcarbamoyltransferase complex ATPase subunit type 1 TsaE [Pseudomonadota bacterium]